MSIHLKCETVTTELISIRGRESNRLELSTNPNSPDRRTYLRPKISTTNSRWTYKSRVHRYGNEMELVREF